MSKEEQTPQCEPDPALEPEEAIVAAQFLDRVQIQGHQERDVMNRLMHKLQMIAAPLNQRPN